MRKLILELQEHVHAEQLLHQQLRSIWHRHPRDAARALARLAPPLIPHQPAHLADIDLVRVAAQHQALQQQLAGSVRD